MPTFDRSAFLQKFALETRTNIQRLNQDFLQVEKSGAEPDLVQNILRTLHTIKGSAKMLNLKSISELTHAFEEAVTASAGQKTLREPSVLEFFLRCLDRLLGHLDDVARDGFSNLDITGELASFEKITAHDLTGLPSTSVSVKPLESSTPPSKKTGRSVTLDRNAFVRRFITEANEHIQNLNAGTKAWQKKSDDADAIERCVRAAHTLKGSARMMKFETIGNLSQRIEMYFRGVKDGKLRSEKTAEPILKAAYEALQTLIVSVETTGKDQLEEAALLDVLDQLNAGAVLPAGIVDQLKTKPVPAAVPAEPLPEATGSRSDRLGERLIQARLITREQLLQVNQTTDASIPLGERLIALGMITREQLQKLLKEQQSSRELLGQSQIQTARITAGEEVLGDQFVHIRIDKLDSLIQSVSDLATRQIKNEEQLKSLRHWYTGLRNWSRWFWDRPSMTREQKEEWQPLLQRLNELLDGFSRHIKSAREDAANFDLTVADLQNGIMTMRMVPIRSVFDGFPRAVRDLAKSLGKEVRLVVEGADTELDRKIVESLNEPLIHLIRNALDHGIEPPEERLKKNKSREGLLRISAFHEGHTILIEIEDDGNGIDIPRIRERAIEKKIVTDDQDIARFSENDWVNMIFLPAFSTSEMITDISGRGYGMDVVKRAIEQLKGSIDIVTARHVGTRFSIHLPLTLTALRAIFVKVGTHTLAIPLSSVAETLKIKTDAIIEVVEKKAIRLRNQIIPLAPMASVVGVTPSETEQDERFIVIIHANGERAGFVVDDIVDEREILVKSLPKSFSKIKHVSSATVSSRDDIIMVLHAPDLIRSTKDFSVREQPSSEHRTARSILVVDDSLNTREIEKTILQAYGYDVDTAKDGLDALDKLKQRSFDLVVTDLEMPAMDGLTLTGKLKSDQAFQHIPVIIVTSRDSADDKRRGIEAGANAYIVKGSFDQTNLIDTVESLIG